MLVVGGDVAGIIDSVMVVLRLYCVSVVVLLVLHPLTS